jgi:hypothetical protein
VLADRPRRTSWVLAAAVDGPKDEWDAIDRFRCRR